MSPRVRLSEDNCSGAPECTGARIDARWFHGRLWTGPAEIRAAVRKTVSNPNTRRTQHSSSQRAAIALPPGRELSSAHPPPPNHLSRHTRASPSLVAPTLSHHDSYLASPQNLIACPYLSLPPPPPHPLYPHKSLPFEHIPQSPAFACRRCSSRPVLVFVYALSRTHM